MIEKCNDKVVAVSFLHLLETQYKLRPKKKKTIMSASHFWIYGLNISSKGGTVV